LEFDIAQAKEASETIIGFYPIKPAHRTLGLVPEILDPMDVILLIGKQLRVVDTPCRNEDTSRAN
jgi:hypothetical protein